MRLLRPQALFALIWLASPVRAEETKFLPFLGARLEAARYAPANEEFAWVGWIGATADLVERGKWSAYFNPAVETVLGHRVRSFEAVQANYSLEIGARVEVGRGRISPFFHHVSRHIQDRTKLQAVDWNFLGVSYTSPLPERWKRRGGYSGSFGLATLSSGVHYKWEGRASIDVDLARKDERAVFALADVRYVGADPSIDFARGGFADVRVEAGVRRFQETSQFALFVAYEHRNDASITSSLVIDRTLLGFRIRSHRRSEPAIPPRP
ncbi:MAG: hypothetical protein ABI565_01840 [Vicinamibacteria bacterium]